MALGILEKIHNLMFGEPDPELIRLDKGESECATCSEKIKNRQIYMVPLQDKHYCKAHAKEEVDRIREQSFAQTPDDMKSKVKFSKENGFHLQCVHCSKRMTVLDQTWARCNYCHSALCLECAAHHSCKEKEEAGHAEREHNTPKRCEFCGKKIVADTSAQCSVCKAYYCLSHEEPEHHDCRSTARHTTQAGRI